MKVAHVALLQLFNPFLLFGEIMEDSKKRFWVSNSITAGFISNLTWKPSSSDSKTSKSLSIDKKTLGTVLARKNPRFVKSILGEPDAVKKIFRRTFYVYYNPNIPFKGEKSNQELVIVFINGMVSEIRHQ